MQEIKLLRHHALKCPSCGTLRVGSGKTGKCFNEECGHTWTLMNSQRGGTRGVIDSYYCPKQATQRVMREKERMVKK